MPMPGTNGHPIRQSPAIPGDETILAPRPDVRSDDTSDERHRKDARRQVALVEGSTPHLTTETRDLLRSRLRIAALLFFAGFLAFFVRWFFHWNEWNTPEHRVLFYAHAVVTIVLGAFGVGLCRHCSYSLP